MKQILRLGESYTLSLVKRYIRYVLLIVIGVVLLPNSKVQAQTLIKGKVADSVGKEPLSGVTITVKGTSYRSVTNTKGEYQISASPRDILVFYAMGYKVLEVKPNGSVLNVLLQTDAAELEEVEVSTGYQHIPKERATGSFTYIDSTLLNRSVSTNILDRLKGVASGVLFDPTTGTSTGLNVRGRSTIFANTDPLIVLDYFPYDGDLSTINPNDVSSITILKDAAASSIWGVRASNGVIVITTKSGKFNEPVKVSFNSNITVGEKPKLYSSKELEPDDVIDLEEYLYREGYYSLDITNKIKYLSPVIQTFADLEAGNITANEADEQINALKGHDLRDDLLKYYYRNSVNQQYSLSLSGGGKQNKYYISGGYDHNLTDVVKDKNDRFSLNAQNTYSLINDRLEINAGITFSVLNDHVIPNNIITDTYIRPYTSLANDQGNHLAIATYKQSWVDTVGGGQLLDWSWKPLDELEDSNNKSSLTNYQFNLGLQYTVLKGLEIRSKYQYLKGTTSSNYLYDQKAYYTRDLINTYSKINYQTGEVLRPVPEGDIMNRSDSEQKSHQIRTQINYKTCWTNQEINLIAGWELKDYKYITNSNTLYGYNPDLGSIATIDYVNQYNNLVSGSISSIPGSPSQAGTTDRYISLFANAIYVYKERYNLSGSIRRDESNLFGVKANEKGVPLWSLGTAWTISKENFFHVKWLDLLKIRFTNGYNGNVDKTVSAYVTAQAISGSGGRNLWANQFASLVNPPNPSLRWEKINITNLAIDFSLLCQRLGGSLEYYYKKGNDIIGDSPLPPSAGVTKFRGNSANITGNGFDVNIKSINVRKQNFQWFTDLLFSKAIDQIKDYKVNTTALSFHKGYPYSGIFSYRWAGLDPLTGDPQGYNNGNVSKDWSSINNKDSLGITTQYNGPGTPKYYGSLRNTFQYKQFSLSFNLTYKLGYYFRAPSINYTNAFSLSVTHTDYNNRWKQPGDELTTVIPSRVYPASPARDLFYANSSVLAESGNHVRLQDVQVNYNFKLAKNSNGRFVSTLYVYASNLGIIWSENKKDLDPENLDLAAIRTISFGFKTNF